MRIISHNDTEVRGIGDSGNFTLRLSGKTVQSLEGLGGPVQPGAIRPGGGSPGNLPPIAVN